MFLRLKITNYLYDSAKVGRRDIAKKKKRFCVTVYTELIATMELGESLATSLNQSREQYSHIAIFTNLLGHLLMERHTIRSTIH
jgi:hypothetical protein